jgi:hypothetical protein
MNFYDYLTWRGDLTFDRDQFNIVDNLLFAYSAYTDLREVITTDEPITVHEAAERFFKLHTEEECLKSGSLIAHAPVVLRRMGESRRFGDLLITDYVREIDEETSTQFSAMHFVINNRISYVAFCGTDDTIIGWKEDFQLSYKTVSSELKAAEYINRTADKMFHNYYVGGHSKGGTLAVYAAMEAKPSVKGKILKVYSNDGPGISDISVDKEKFETVRDRIVKIIPEFSVFGLLFDNGEEKKIVKTSKSGLYQHDPIGWQVSGTDFVCGTSSDYAPVIQDVLNEFLKTMTLAEREDLVNEMYSAFVKAGIENTTDFTKQGIPVLIKFLREVTSLNENARASLDKLLSVVKKMLSEKVGEAVKSKVNDVGDVVKNKVNDVGDAVKNKVNDVAEALPEFIKPSKNRKLKKTDLSPRRETK